MQASPVYAILAQLACAAACASEYSKFDTSQADSVIDLAGYQQVWADEFDVLNASRPGRGSGPWFTGVHAVLAQGEKMAVHLPDPAYSVVSGVLEMSTRLDPVDSMRVEAHLQTDDQKGHSIEFQNGYFEARMWVPVARGSHAGLWLLSKEKGLGHTEIDVVETYGKGDASIHSSTHIWPVAPASHAYASKRVVKADIFDDFHLYGVLATDNYFVFYCNRKETARIARLPEQRVPLYLLLSVFGNPSQPVIEPAVMKIDYVRVYLPKPVPKAPTLHSSGG